MASLDVVSLFTNIPQQLAVNAIKDRWEEISMHTTIDRDHFIQLINLCFECSYFNYKDQFYKQIFGTAMGSPLSPALAELVLQNLEEHCLKDIDFKVTYFRYVDDTLIFAPNNKIQYLLDRFNSFHESLQFTMELQKNDSIDFLDITVHKHNNQVQTNWYRKPTWSGRYLHFHSYVPRSQKINTIINLTDRAVLLSDPDYIHDNLNIIRKTLLENKYPLHLINKIINNRIQYLNNKNQNNHTNIESNNSEKNFITMPYIDEIHHKSKNLFSKSNLTLTTFSTNNLQCLSSKLKTQTPLLKQKDLVYQVDCSDCDGQYVGETMQHLSKRMNQHKNNKHQVNQFQSMLTHHSLINQHTFDLKNPKVLYKETNTFKRKFVEGLIINSNDKAINKRNECHKFHDNYKIFLTSHSSPTLSPTVP